MRANIIMKSALALFLWSLSHASLFAQLSVPSPSDSSSDNKVARLSRIQQDLSQLGQDQQRLGGAISGLHQSLESMLADVAAIRPPKKTDKPPEPPREKQPQRVSFRPPLERLTEKEDITVVCQNGRLSVL